MIGDSNRIIDPEFGYLTVKNCILTGEDVAKYYGYEIPNFIELGLKKEKLYDVYRPQEEIESSDFTNMPLLSQHVDFSADDYKFKFIVGTIGETALDGDQLKGTVVFWDKKAIDELDKGKKCLSCGYMYTPILEQGNYNGKKYDVRMTKIVANHVAVVDNPRYKPAIVADELKQKGDSMSDKKISSNKYTFDAEIEEIKSILIGDASEEEKEKAVEKVKEKLEDKVKDKKAKDKKAKDKAKDKKECMGEDKKDEEMDPDEEDMAEDEELENEHQEENEKKDSVKAAKDTKKMTGDSIRKIVADSVASEMKKFHKKTLAFDSAIKEYERIFGQVNRMAFDSAEKVLDTILKNKKHSFEGKSFEQKQAMVEMIPSGSSFKNEFTSVVSDSFPEPKSEIPDNLLNFMKKRMG